MWYVKNIRTGEILEFPNYQKANQYSWDHGAYTSIPLNKREATIRGWIKKETK